uniref:Cytochrome P450 n=1 Tax=Candidatus Kentrum sp. UNK TaxID=2126344 RepID=A0A451ARX1_9GAMM|nr:MAG: hypothetical protein BECKUNK1418G_GA0071005_100834 [Candidatus Kentron sp. UNK]VFK68791.1 MAG: hypothetical protein BECKUNK1418H_GA0071006_100621 [Candidatus Kentron sp. UNK]
MPLPFEPRSAAFRATPYPTYHHLRTHHPIWYRPEHEDWVLTRYADISNVLTNRAFGRSEEESMGAKTTTTNRPMERLLSFRRESQKLVKQWLVLRNAPDHTRIRRLFHDPFTPSRIRTLREDIQARVDTLIDHVEAQGKADIIGDFAHPLTLGINCERLLGIPESAWHPRFDQWSEGVASMADLDVTPIANERGLLAIAGLSEYFRDRVAEFRASPRQDGLIGAFIEAETAGQLTEEELVANCIMMFTVGHSSTTNLIGIAIRTLLDHPAQMRLLRDNPASMDSAISEILRYDSPVQGVARTALSDVRLSNRIIRCGEVVNCLIGAANRDPDRFPEPDEFRIGRHPNPYLSFGLGTHICTGRHLAKSVAEIAVGALIHRLPRLSLATDDLEWEESFLGHGLKSLPVVF